MVDINVVSSVPAERPPPPHPDVRYAVSTVPEMRYRYCRNWLTMALYCVWKWLCGQDPEARRL